jgi:hypothetical protein
MYACMYYYIRIMNVRTHVCMYEGRHVVMYVCMYVYVYMYVFMLCAYICITYVHIVFCMARQPYMGLGLLVSSRFHGHTHLRHTTVGRTPLDE